MLLQEGPFHHQNFTSIVNKRCAQFLRGEWEHLYQVALDNNQRQNDIQSQRQSRPGQQSTPSKRHSQVLQQARDLNYSRAMNLLRSPGMSADPPAVIYAQLQALHPKDSAPLQLNAPQFSVPTSELKFITGKLVGKLLWRAKRGTAVDQSSMGMG